MGNEVIPKPLTLLREDFIVELLNLCNESNLPYFIMEDVMKDVVKDLHVAHQKQLEPDRSKYSAAMNQLAYNKG